MKQLEVQIMGQSYLLGCPAGGESALLDAVNRVDLAMCKIRDAGKIKSRDRIAVLAALNLVFENQAPAPTPANAEEANAPAPAQAEAVNALSEQESTKLLALLARMDAALVGAD